MTTLEAQRHALVQFIRGQVANWRDLAAALSEDDSAHGIDITGELPPGPRALSTRFLTSQLNRLREMVIDRAEADATIARIAAKQVTFRVMAWDYPDDDGDVPRKAFDA